MSFNASTPQQPVQTAAEIAKSLRGQTINDDARKEFLQTYGYSTIMSVTEPADRPFVQGLFDYMGRLIQQQEIYVGTVQTDAKREVNKARLELATAEETAKDMKEALAIAQTQLDSLDLDNLRPRKPDKSEKFPDPPAYDGNREGLRTFITSVKTKLTANADRFPEPQQRAAYVFGRLVGKAQSMIAPHMEQHSCKDAEEVYTLLEHAFGDPDRAGTAESVIMHLKQANRPFATYLHDFYTHIEDTGWNDKAKKSALLTGISHELRVQLVAYPIKNKTLAESIIIL